MIGVERLIEVFALTGLHQIDRPYAGWAGRSEPDFLSDRNDHLALMPDPLTLVLTLVQASSYARKCLHRAVLLGHLVRASHY